MSPGMSCCPLFAHVRKPKTNPAGVLELTNYTLCSPKFIYVDYVLSRLKKTSFKHSSTQYMSLTLLPSCAPTSTTTLLSSLATTPTVLATILATTDIPLA